MRTLLALLAFTLPSFGQTFDFTTGNGAASLLFIQGTLFPPNPLKNPNWNKVPQATFYMQTIDEYWGQLTYTSPIGVKSDGPVPIPTAVYRIYPVNATVTATTVTFTGFAGGPIVNGAAPTPGAPFALPPSFPPGWSAVWKRPIIQQQLFTPYQLFATVGGFPSNSAGYWKPQVP